MQKSTVTEEQAVGLLREFLAEHPGHSPVIEQATLPGETEPETVVDVGTMAAFTDWVIATGRSSDPARARRFREQLREQFGK